MAKPQIRPFVAEMPHPIPGESLIGYFSRALTRTMCRNLASALKLGGLDPSVNGRPRPFNISAETATGLAKLFKVDREQFISQLYPYGTFEYGKDSTIEFFGTQIRPQYHESAIRRVSPRALLISPHHRALWDLRPFSFDPETRERLLYTCPVCGNRLGWSTVHGPTKCDKCVDDRGRPSTDLRDHPQDLLAIDDEEAVDFTVGLVHPDRERRRAAMRLVPKELETATNSDLFEAIIYIASVLRPSNAHLNRNVGRPKSFEEFADLTPDQLALAARAIIGGENGFAIVADAMRATMDKRPASHGLFKELGPLAAMVTDKRLAPAVRLFSKNAVDRDLARTHDIGMVRKRTAQIGRREDEVWLNMNELSKEFGIPESAVKRLAESGHLEVRRAEAINSSPIQMKRTDVKPLAATYKEATNERAAVARLRVPPSVLAVLGKRKIIERIEGPAAALLRDQPHYRLSSINAVLIAIKQQALPMHKDKGVSLMFAVRSFRPHIPWVTIIDLILTGDIKIRRRKSKSRDWRLTVAVEELSDFCKIVKMAAGAETPQREKWLTRGEAAQLLGVVDENMVWSMGRAKLLSVRKHRTTMFNRAEVEAAAKRYVFGPEMLERTVFNINHELNRWLKSRGVEPAFILRGRHIIYDRKKFEASLPFQPPILQKLIKEERNFSVEEKRQVIDAVIGGVSVGYVSRMMGLKRQAVAKWVKEFRKTGEIKGSSKLDAHREYICSIVEQDPKRSVSEILRIVNKADIEVGYCALNTFIKNRGYARDAEGRLGRHH